MFGLTLCVIQDLPPDWSRELQRMEVVYGNALAVFVSHGPSLGLKKVPLAKLQNSFGVDDNPIFCRENINHGSMFSAPQDY